MFGGIKKRIVWAVIGFAVVFAMQIIITYCMVRIHFDQRAITKQQIEMHNEITKLQSQLDMAFGVAVDTGGTSDTTHSDSGR